MFLQRIQKQNTLLLLKLVTLFSLLSFMGSCKYITLPKGKTEAYKILNKITYPYQEVAQQYVAESLKDGLTSDEISRLDNFRNTASFLENFVNTECAGCSNALAQYKPVYKVKKGRFIHFGLKNEIGVENWVFKNSGAFVTRFYVFQGESKEHIQKKLKDLTNIEYNLEGVYPISIDKKHVYLEHVSFERSSLSNNQWYHTLFPKKITYQMQLAEIKPAVRFTIHRGLFSHQTTDENGAYQIVNFVEPLIYPNAVDIDEPMSYSSFTHAFYANATFFILNLDEESKVEIHTASKKKGQEFKFSVFKNDGFYTLKEYLEKEETVYNTYKNSLSAGAYLIRIIHEDPSYTEGTLYTLYIDKEIVN